MSSVDNRIVDLQFKNSQFETAAAQSLSTLDRLKAALQFGSAGKGISDISRAASGINLSPLSNSIEGISGKFLALSTIAITALSNITTKAISAGTRLLSSLTIDPIKQGFNEYETQLNAVQTILANTSAAGTKLKDVNAVLNELNTYADKTIYNFSEMTKNIGTFTAAGVDLKTATSSIKGIANLAALSGSNSQQASTAMYQLSQAISSGKVSLQDWNSVVNAGMGGTVFQRALAQTAERMGTVDKGAVKLTGKMKNVTIAGKSFRESITAAPGEKSWLTSDVLTTTLSQFTGDLKDSELAAIGFNKAQIKAIQAQAKVAQDAATKVKTVTQLLGTLREAVGSGWAQTWQTVFGDFTEAKVLFTDVSNTLGGIIGASAKARNKMFTDWKTAGGRTALIDGISTAFHSLMTIVTAITDAFHEFFPSLTGKQLADFSKQFADLTKRLTPSKELLDKIVRAVSGFFAILDIGKMVLGQAFGLFKDLFAQFAGPGASSLLDTAANLGDFFVNLRNGIKNGKGLPDFFNGIRTAIARVLKVTAPFRQFFGDVISTLSGKLATLKFPDFALAISPITELGNLVVTVWDKVISKLHDIADAFSKIPSKISGFAKDIGFGGAAGGLLNSFDFEGLRNILKTGTLLAVIIGIRNIFKALREGGDELKKAATSYRDAYNTLKAPFEQLTKTLETMQNTLKAATLLQIAGAIFLLALGVSALSKIDAGNLVKALVALSYMFILLTGALAVLQKIEIGKGYVSLVLLAVAVDILASAVVKLADVPTDDLIKGLLGVAGAVAILVIAAQLMPDGKKMISSSAGLILMATAVKILAQSVTSLAGLSWEDMSRGLAGVGGLLLAMGLFARFSGANKSGILAGAGLVLLATGVKILASAVIDIAQLSWEQIAKGLVGVGVGVGILATALSLIPAKSVFSAAAVLAVSVALKIIASALQDVAGLSWEEIGKGLVSIGGAIAIISAALMLIPPTAVFSAAAIVAVSVAIGLIGAALISMGGQSWESIAKGLVTLAGALAIIAIAMQSMVLALPGALALIVVAGALSVLTPLLLIMGNMSWEEIAKGLTLLAGVFVVLGLAGLLLTPVLPTLFGLAAAIALLGAGMALAGIGMLAFATGLSALAVAGAAGAAALVAIIATISTSIPLVMEQIGLGIIAFAKVIATAGPAMFAAMTAVLGAILDSIIKLTPKIILTLMIMLDGLLRALVFMVPRMVDAGLKLIIGILNGIAKNIKQLTIAAVNVITQFIAGISASLPRIIQSGVNLLLAFLNGIADAIRNNSDKVAAAGVNIGSAIIEGMIKGIAGGINAIDRAVRRIANTALDAAKSVLGIHSPSKAFEALGKFSAQGYAKGLTGSKDQINAASALMRDLLAKAMKSELENIGRLEARLKKLSSARVRDRAAIAATTRELAAARAEYKRTVSANKLLPTFKDENARLQTYRKQLDSVNAKLVDSRKNLEDAKKARDDYRKSLEDQFSNLPDIAVDQTLESYTKNLEKQIADTQIFTAQLQELRKMGLGDAMYKELLAKGPSAIPFISQILDQGQGAVDQLNTLDSALARSAASLATEASDRLYQAGVDAAAGLVKGLEAQQASLVAAMDKLADAMVAAIKKKLGIRSPSRVFKTVGVFSAQGVAEGLLASRAPIAAAEKVGANAIEAMRKTISDMSGKGLGDLDLAPTIRPVLDLSAISQGAGQIEDLLGTSIDVNAVQARSAVGELLLNKEDLANLAGAASGDSYNFTQNLSSPKALSNAEIYRQNKNLISTALSRRK